MQEASESSDSDSASDGPTIAADQSLTNTGDKRKRVSRACEECRRKRIKCSGTIPCRGCTSNPQLCVFRTDPDEVNKKRNLMRRTKMTRLEQRMEFMEKILGLELEGQGLPVVEIKSSKKVRDGSFNSVSESSASGSDYPQSATLSSISSVPQTLVTFQERPAFQSKPLVSRGRVNPPVQELSPASVCATLQRDAYASAEQSSVISQVHVRSNVPVPHILPTHKTEPHVVNQTRGAMIMEDSNLFTYYGGTSALGGDTAFNPWQGTSKFMHGILIGTSNRIQPSTVIHIGSIIPCPPELVNHLVSNFFQQLHPVFPMVDKQAFMAEVIEVMESGEVDRSKDWAFLLLLISIITVMLQFTPSLRKWGIATGPEVLAQACLNHAKQMIHERLDEMHVYAVQALILLALSAAGRGGRASHMWTFTGMAVRMAQEMGLHRSLQNAGISHSTLDAQTQIRSRTWFCVLIADTYVSVLTGRPLAIHSTDWDCVYPNGTSEDIENLLMHVELAGIFGTISRFANRARPIDRKFFIDDVKSRLVRWYSIVPHTWSNRFFSRWDARAFMLTMYHSAKILFQRVAFARADDETCLASAEAVMQIVDAMPAIDLESDSCCVIFPTVPYALMMTCGVWITRYFTASASPEVQEQCLANVRRCLHVFDNMRGLSVASMSVSRVFTEYLAMKGIRWPEFDKWPKVSSKAHHHHHGHKHGQHQHQHPGAGTAPAPFIMNDSPALNEGLWWEGLNLLDLAGLGGLPGHHELGGCGGPIDPNSNSEQVLQMQGGSGGQASGLNWSPARQKGAYH